MITHAQLEALRGLKLQLKCWEMEREDRWQHIADADLEIIKIRDQIEAIEAENNVISIGHALLARAGQYADQHGHDTWESVRRINDLVDRANRSEYCVYGGV